MVGGYIPQPLATTFGLSAVYFGMTRSELLQTVIQTFLRKNAPSESQMIRELALRAYSVWQTRVEEAKKKNTKIEFEDFKKEAREKLQKRKLSDETIEAIISKIGVVK